MNSHRLMVILSGYYGFDNAGDEAVLAGITEALRKTAPALDIYALSGNPNRTEAEHEIIGIPRMSPLAIIRALRRANLLISGGGSLLQDVSSVRTVPYYAGIIRLAKAIGIPVFMYAQGIGPLEGSIGRRITANLRSSLDGITVRDKDSADLLIKLGYTAAEIEITADPVFGLTPLAAADGLAALNRESIPRGIPTIAISLRKFVDDNKVIDSVRRLIRDLVEKGFQIVLVPFQHPDDLRFCDDVAEGCSGDRLYVLRQAYSPRQLMTILGLFDFVIGMRLHSLIFSARMNVPFLGLSYDPKVSSLCKILNATYIDIDAISSEFLIDLFDKDWKRRGELRQQLSDLVPRLAEQALYTATRAVELAKRHRDSKGRMR